MKKLAFGALLVGLLVACGGDDGPDGKVVLPDGGSNVPMTCNPLTQAGCGTGEKCTWLLDALMPQYVGHVGCAPDGTAAIGDACMYGEPGAAGFDGCVKGAVCGNYRGGAGVCKQICDQQGGTPTCDDAHVCVTYSRLFSSDSTQPAAAGVCDLRCDPLNDNDFDGSADTLTGAGSQRRANICGTDPNVGCYGSPRDTPPGTGWSCTGDINSETAQPIGLRHRVQCVDSNMCSDAGTSYINSCTQGDLPRLRESSFVSEAVCVALCKPATCYSGNCGSNNVNRHGVANDSCRDADRVAATGKEFGLFNGGSNDPDGGEHCAHSWIFEINDQNELIESQTSDTVGFCYNHEVYRWDSDNNGMISETDQSYPNCARLGSGFGSANYTGSDGAIAFGALDFGCVPTDFIPMAANGKVAPEVVKALRRVDLPRVLYHRTMGAR